MMRKGLYTILVVCLLAMAPASVALAQKPEPPDGLEESFGPPLLDPSLPPLDVQEVPEAVQKAVQLRESLTPKQIAAINAMQAKYGPEMQAISEALAAATGMDVGKMALAEPAAAELQRIDADLLARMQALVSDLDAEMAAILDADQFALHQAALMGPDEPLHSAVSSGGGVAPAEAEGYTSACFYSPYYGSYAKYYAYYGYLYAYYAYAVCGTSCYNAYYYAYYGYWYARYALEYSAPSYFGAYYTGMVSVYNSYSSIYWGYYWGYQAYYANYYSYVYAANCYSGCSNTYSNYSYYYNYYSYYYGYYTYANAYNCYANW